MSNFPDSHSTLSTAGRGAFTATDSNDIPLAAEAPFDPKDDLLPPRALRGDFVGLGNVVRDRRANLALLGVAAWPARPIRVVRQTFNVSRYGNIKR